jgi:hypothetical protein
VSTDPDETASLEDFTIEIRDSRGIPCVQARLMAPNMAQALAKAAANDDSTEWVFLQELTGTQLIRMLGEYLKEN